jgi:hypothetical protein
MAARHQLRTKADAEHGLVGGAEFSRQVGERFQVWMIGVVDGALFATEDDQSVVALRTIGDSLTLPGPPDVGLDARFGEHRGQRAEGRSDEILDDQHPRHLT